MCSAGVFLETWPEIFRKSISNCNGVFDSRRIRSVSVVIFNGIRLRITMRNGRMSCAEALCESITKMFSDFNISTAGNFAGMFNGISLTILKHKGTTKKRKCETKPAATASGKQNSHQSF